MNLQQALRLDRGARVAFVGAGGKTTALFQLARVFEPPALVTASTHLGEWQASFADYHALISRAEDVQRFSGQIEGVTLYTGGPVSTGGPSGEQRLGGLDAESLAEVDALASRLGFPVLVEADGSRQKPLKAPGEHEPAIPPWVRQVVVVAGLSGLGQPLTDEHVHRAERFSALSGLRMGEPVGEEHLARVLAAEEGGLKNIPLGARTSLLLNQADTEELMLAGMRIAKDVASQFHSVLIASLSEQQRILRVVEPVAGVVLAAGAAARYGGGETKVLLPWRGKPLVRHAVETALASGLSPVVVVLGPQAEQVKDALAGLPVLLTENPDWQMGQSTSLKAGLAALPSESGGAAFLLGDQPLVTPAVIQALVDRHSQTAAAVVIPRVVGKRANPVLFDRQTFPELMDLTGDTGGRAIMERYPVEWVDWADEGLLFDVDTPDDYRRLQGME